MPYFFKLKITKGQTDIVNSEDRLDHCYKNETKDTYSTHNTRLKTKSKVTRTQQKLGRVQVHRKGKQILLN